MSTTDAKAKKAKPTAKSRFFMHIAVLQNGAALVEKVLPLKGNNTLALTSRGRGPFMLEHYPLPEGKLEFLRVVGDHTVLIVDHKWEGFCTSKGELIQLFPGERGRRQITMHQRDYASITCDDLRIMVKLAPAKPVVLAPKVKGTVKAFRRSVFSHFLPTREERNMSFVATLIAGFIIGCACLGLLLRPVNVPKRLSEINEDYMLPFLAPAHLVHAPEALQGNLDRAHEVRSTLEYYRAVAAVLMGWEESSAARESAKSLLFPTTVELYSKLHANAHADLETKVARQEEVDKLQEMKSGVGVLSIPAVRGETMVGSMFRIIDKINVMQRGFATNLEARRKIIAEFPKDPDYDWTQYKDVLPKDERAAAYLKQIRPFEQMTDEEHMYAEAESLAKRASVAQARALRERAGELTHANQYPQPIGIVAGAKFSTFAGNLDFALADEKLLRLQGSTYGDRRAGTQKGAAPAKEALVGEIEPSLIEHYITENRFQLQLCYELALRRNEAAAGTMEWRWRIDARGSISDVALVSSNIGDQRMAECIRRKISTWRFPRPRRGSVEISYPFEFAPSKG